MLPALLIGTPAFAAGLAGARFVLRRPGRRATVLALTAVTVVALDAVVFRSGFLIVNPFLLGCLSGRVLPVLARLRSARR